MKIAWLQRGIVLVMLALASGWFAWWAMRGHAIVAAAGPLVLLSGLPVALAIEFLMMIQVTRAATEAVPPTRAVFAAWWREHAMAWRVFLWRQPFRLRREPDWLPPHGQGRVGVLMVHGLACNRAVWNPWLQRLRALEVPCMAITMEPPFGSIDLYPALIEQAVCRLEQATGTPPVLVGHSMGGLAIRAWLRAPPPVMATPGRNALAQHHARVHSVITVGSPHQGTWLARFASRRNAREMRHDSPWLMTLAGDEDTRQRSIFTCYASRCDQIVFPPQAWALEGAAHVRLPDRGHLDLLNADVIFDDLLGRVAPPLSRPKAA
jgi:triacylglycerol esterase/lipase EstA (alpha/beta hydrolase family)